MPTFRYTVVDPNGKRITKSMAAANKVEVVQYLQQSGMFIIQVTDQPVKSSTLKQLRVRDKIDFTRNISVLLSSGISLGEALAIMADDTTNKGLHAFYSTIRGDLERGTPLSKALSGYPDIFDPVYLALVSAGENSGQLDTVLASMADSLEKNARMQSEVRSALLYPGFVLMTLFVLGGAIAFFVLPRITKIFDQLNVQLPLATRLLVQFSKLLEKYPLFILLGILLVGLGTFFFFRSKRGKHLLHIIAMRVPLIKNILNFLDLYRLASTLALLLNAGIPIQEALRTAGGTVTNPKLQKEFALAGEKLATGTAFAVALQQTSLPKTFIALVAVGERSGKITSIFTTLAAHYDQQLTYAIRNFTATLEPVLTLIVGLLVGMVVITIMVPIYQFVGNLQNLR